MPAKCKNRVEIRLDRKKAAKLLLMGLELDRLRKLYNAGYTIATDQRHLVDNHLNNASSYLNHAQLAGMFHLRQAAAILGGTSFLK